MERFGVRVRVKSRVRVRVGSRARVRVGVWVGSMVRVSFFWNKEVKTENLECLICKNTTENN